MRSRTPVRYREIHDLCLGDKIATAFTVVSWEPWLREMIERMRAQQDMQDKLQEARDQLRQMQNELQNKKKEKSEEQEKNKADDKDVDEGAGEDEEDEGDSGEEEVDGDSGEEEVDGDEQGNQDGDEEGDQADEPSSSGSQPGSSQDSSDDSDTQDQSPGAGAGDGDQEGSGPSGSGPGDDDGGDDGTSELEERLAAQQALVDELKEDADYNMEATSLANAASVSKMIEQAAEDRGTETALALGCGYGHDQIQKLPFEDREQLKALAQRPDFKEFADFFGSFRNYTSPASHRSPDVMEELIGLTKGSTIDRLTQDQLAMLAHPKLKAIVMRDILNDEAQLYDYEGDAETGGGACVVVVDESSSVIPHNPAIKAFIANLAILFKKEQRPFHVIHFDSSGYPHNGDWPGYQEQYFHQTGIKEITELVETFCGGGTEFIAPLERAAEFIEKNCFNSEAVADILIITDGEPADLYRGPVSESWIEKFHERLNKVDAFVWGLAVGNGGNSWSLKELTQGRLATVQDFQGKHADPLAKIINGIQRHRKAKKGKAA